MKFQILLSTMNDKYLRQHLGGISDKYLIINQLTQIEKSDFTYDNVYSFQEKGLSKSRNRALELCQNGIVLIADDDVTHVKEVEKVILNAYAQYKDADIITFQIVTPNGEKFKKYNNKSYWHNYRTLMGISSIEISFKVDSIKKFNLKFDERFGLGSEFCSSEETIFLTNAYKCGLKILYLPIPIVKHSAQSSGANYMNDKLIESKGAIMHRIFGNKSYFISLYFALRKYRDSNLNFINFYSKMLQGIKKFKQSPETKHEI